MTNGAKRVFLSKLFIVAFSLSLTIGALEVALRVAGYIPSYSDPTLFRLENDIRQYGLSPGWKGLFAGAGVHINQLGLRGPDISTSKGGEEYRILILGDSVAFGQGVEAEKTFSGFLEQILKEARPRLSVKVINAGVPGYNTRSEVDQLQMLWPKVAPDLVVLSYLVDNDSDVEPGIRLNPLTGNLDIGLYSIGLLNETSYFLHRHSRLYNLVRSRIRILLFSIDQYHAKSSQDFFSPHYKGWSASRLALLELKSICEQRNVPLIVGGIALVLRLEGTNQLESFVAERGFHYVRLWQTENLTEYFSKYALSGVDGHPNTQAHRLIAARLADVVLPFIPPN